MRISVLFTLFILISYTAQGQCPEFTGSSILPCLLYTSDAADERSSEDLGGRRIIKKTTEVDRSLTNKIASMDYTSSSI